MKIFALRPFAVGLTVYILGMCQPIWANEKTCNDELSVDLTTELEANYLSQYQHLIEVDNQFLKTLNDQPAETYLKLRTDALGELKSKRDFGFAPNRFIVERIVQDLTQRLERKFGGELKQEILKTRRAAKKLLTFGNPPYKATIRFIMFKYLPLLDMILGKRHPQYMENEYHRRNAEHLIEKLMRLAPDLFLYFTFGDVDEDFFVNTRTALMNAIGISVSGLDDVSEVPYGDMFYMKISEFAYHDIGHAEFTSGRDVEYLRKSGKDLVRVVWEWEVTRRRIKAVIDQVKARDQDLGEAMTAILFELLRERGFQYSLTVLKQELETIKWSEVIKIKHGVGFYSRYHMNEKKFSRLDEARQLLVSAVERLKEEDQLNWNTALRANIVPCRVTHTPHLTFSQGRLKQIEISKTGPVQVRSVTAVGNEEATPIRELISAQVHPTKESPFTKEIIEKMERALGVAAVEVIFVKTDKTIEVRLKNGDVLPLAEFSVDPIAKPGRKLENIEVFEMNQVLGTEERQQLQRYTIRPPVEVYSGNIMTEKDLVTGRYSVTLKTLDGKVVKFPLVEIRIDPL